MHFSRYRIFLGLLFGPTLRLNVNVGRCSSHPLLRTVNRGVESCYHNLNPEGAQPPSGVPTIHLLAHLKVSKYYEDHCRVGLVPSNTVRDLGTGQIGSPHVAFYEIKSKRLVNVNETVCKPVTTQRVQDVASKNLIYASR